MKRRYYESSLRNPKIILHFDDEFTEIKSVSSQRDSLRSPNLQLPSAFVPHIIGDRDFPVPQCCRPRRACSSSPLWPSKVRLLKTTAPTLAVPVTAFVSLQFPSCLAPTGLYEGVTIMPADILTSMWLLGVYGERGGGRTLSLLSGPLQVF